MEPRSFDHGNFKNNRPFSELIPLLQWSHDLSTMEMYLWIYLGSPYDLLQWSHDLSTMEIRNIAGKEQAA